MSQGPLTGQVVGGRYRLGELLGQGGMGVVYRAAQESLARPVAVKVLQPVLSQDAEAVARFRAEAERAGRLAHPHIVQILDFGHEPGGAAWIAMELLSGESLAARIERGPLSEAELVKVGLETLSALEAAHAASLVHRDLKPDNVFLSAVPGIGASAKVLDFGIAKLVDTEGAGKLTATGTLIGTPLYMAPEQAKGLPVDRRADLYALGAVMYEALSGRPPLTASSYPALLVAILTDEPAPLSSLRPEVSAELAAIVHRALEKDPARRFQTAAEMADALRSVQVSTSVPTRRGVPDAGPAAMAATALTPAPAPPTRAPAPAPSAQAAPAPAPSAAPSGRLGWVLAAALGGGLIALLVPRLLPPSSVPPSSVPPPSAAPATAAPAAASVAMVPLGPEPSVTAAPGSVPDAAPPIIDAGIERAAPEAVARVDRRVRPDRGGAGERADPPPPSRGTVTVSPSAYRWGGMASSADLRGPIEAAGGWSACWPREVPLPTVNQGRAFLIDLAGDGHVVRASPTGVNDPEQFGACVSRRLERLTFPAPRSGEPVQVRVDFSLD